MKLSCADGTAQIQERGGVVMQNPGSHGALAQDVTARGDQAPGQVQRKATGGRGEANEQGRGLEAAAVGVGAAQQKSHELIATPNEMVVIQGASGVSVVQHSQGVAVQGPSKVPDAEGQGTSNGTVQVSAKGQAVNQGSPGVQNGQYTAENTGVKGLKSVQGANQSANQGVQRGTIQGNQSTQKVAQAPGSQRC